MNVSSIIREVAPWLIGLAVFRVITPAHTITDADRKDVKILDIKRTNWILFDRLRIEYQPKPIELHEDPLIETTYSFQRIEIESRVFKNLHL